MKLTLASPRPAAFSLLEVIVAIAIFFAAAFSIATDMTFMDCCETNTPGRYWRPGVLSIPCDQ